MSQSAFWPVKPSDCIENRVRVKISGMARGLANARPPGSAKFANAPPAGLTRWANALHVVRGGWALVELTDALEFPAIK